MIPLRSHRFALPAVLALALATAAGCSTSSSSPTTTGGPASSTTTNPNDLPATGSANGATLSVTSSPQSGTVGSTTMRVTATLTGAIPSATLSFQISNSPTAAQSHAATSQHVTVAKAGVYAMPVPFKPTKAGNWSVTVTYTPGPSTDSKLTVSGLPPFSGAPAPFPQLVTVVSAG